MLFEQILKYTPDEHIEKQNMIEALQIVSDIADFVNTSSKNFENSKILLGISSLLKDKYNVLISHSKKGVNTAI